MYTELGNQSEIIVLNELKRIFPEAKLKNNKTHGIDILMKLWSRKLKIEVKSCCFRVPNNKNHTKFKKGKFILYPHNFERNDIFIFHIRDINLFRIFPISYLQFIFQDKIKKNKDKRVFFFTVNQILQLEYFTLEYILKHYCNEPSCSFDCLFCPFNNKNTINHFIEYLEATK